MNQKTDSVPCSPQTAALHHEVLRHWAEWRRTHEDCPDVISFDFHTDTLSAVRRGVPPPEPGAWQNPQTVENAVAALHHDEHFDWALRSGLVGRVLIFSIAPQNGPCAHERMEVLRHPDLPDVNDLLNHPESFRSLAEQMLSDAWLKPLLEHCRDWRSPLILDLDCDYILTEKTMSVPQHSVFGELLRKAALITFSRESDWVHLLRFPGETITGESVVQTLLRQFQFQPASSCA